MRMNPLARIPLILVISIATGAVAADDVAENEYAEMFPGLSPGPVEYDFLTMLDDVYELWEVEPPRHVFESLIEHHDLTAEAASKLYVISPMARDRKYLAIYGIAWREEGADSEAAKLHREIIDQNCRVMIDAFPDYCQSRDPHRRSGYAVVDAEDGVLGVLPHFFRSRDGIPSILSGDIVHAATLNHVRDRYISFELSSDIVATYTFGLAEGESRSCLSGKFGMADFDADGNSDFMLVHGDIMDDIYAHQVEPKVKALTRVNFAVIRLDKNGSRILITDELFSYEMDYTQFYEFGAGQGIYRDSKYYWGDYDADGVSDYMVRRRQGPLAFTGSDDDDRYIASPYEESAILYLGQADGSYVRFAPEDEQAFVDFVVSETDWSDGFPDHTRCR